MGKPGEVADQIVKKKEKKKSQTAADTLDCLVTH